MVLSIGWKKGSSWKTHQIQNQTLFETKLAKIDALFVTKTAKNPYLMLSIWVIIIQLHLVEYR